ncbi:hypothetical protein [Streptomyces guryensis]|uniref:hypothetical protein n=1 Tax=Streptomyces guryensis TaxID=2886947 RepID=UPI001E499387|nr:hypothetical protein [Streptomyces guryensis]
MAKTNPEAGAALGVHGVAGVLDEGDVSAVEEGDVVQAPQVLRRLHGRAATP